MLRGPWRRVISWVRAKQTCQAALIRRGKTHPLLTDAPTREKKMVIAMTAKYDRKKIQYVAKQGVLSLLHCGHARGHVPAWVRVSASPARRGAVVSVSMGQAPCIA